MLRACCIHCACCFWDTRVSSSSSTVFASPVMCSAVETFLLISARSMSMCSTFALGANAFASPSARSEKRTPTAMSRSQRCIAMFAACVPCMPSMPSILSLEAGAAPRPISVETIGASTRFASCISSSCAPEIVTPPPQ